MKLSNFLKLASALFIISISCGQKQQKNHAQSETEMQNTINQTIEISNLQKISISDIPDMVAYMGELKEVYRYFDKTGENILILTETDVTTSEDEDGEILSHKALYAYRFLNINNKSKEEWCVNHRERECINYPVAEFVKDALSITDLDNNGIAEIWVIFIASCRGDFSPDKLFITMYENNVEYRMTGERKLKFAGEVIGGEYTFNQKFRDNNTSQAFREYGIALWEKYVEN